MAARAVEYKRQGRIVMCCSTPLLIMVPYRGCADQASAMAGRVRLVFQSNSSCSTLRPGLPEQVSWAYDRWRIIDLSKGRVRIFTLDSTRLHFLIATPRRSLSLHPAKPITAWGSPSRHWATCKLRGTHTPLYASPIFRLPKGSY